VQPGDEAKTSPVAGLEHALERYAEVAAVYLYGSTARGQATPLSDVDLAVVLMPGVGQEERARLQRRLLTAVGRALSGRRVDLRFLDDLPVAVRGRIVYEGVRVFERDAVVRLRQEVKARLEYHDFLAFERAGLGPGLAGLRRKLVHG